MRVTPFHIPVDGIPVRRLYFSVRGLLIHSLLDGLLVGDLRRTNVGFHLELAEQTVHDDLQVQLAHAGDDIGGAQRFPQNGRKPFAECKGIRELDCDTEDVYKRQIFTCIYDSVKYFIYPRNTNYIILDN